MIDLHFYAADAVKYHIFSIYKIWGNFLPKSFTTLTIDPVIGVKRFLWLHLPHHRVQDTLRGRAASCHREGHGTSEEATHPSSRGSSPIGIPARSRR